MSNDVPKSEKVLRTADEIAPQELNSADASADSYYQLLLKKCRSQRALQHRGRRAHKRPLENDLHCWPKADIPLCRI